MKTVIALAIILLAPVSAWSQDTALPAPLQALLEAAAADPDPNRFGAAVEIMTLTQSAEALLAGAENISSEHGEIARQALGLAARADAASASADTVPVVEPQGWRNAPRRTVRTLAHAQSTLWTGQLRLGFRQDSGNSDQLDYSTALSLERDLSVWGFQAALDYSYAEADGSVGRDALSAQAQIDREVGERWTVFTGTRYEQDALSSFDWTSLIDAGVGYRILTGERRSWRLQAGPAVRFLSPVDEDVRHEVAAELSSDLDWRLSESLAFTADSQLLLTGQSRFEQSLALQTNLSELWAIQLAFRYRNEFEPEPGFERVDTRTDLSVVRSF